MRFGAIACLCLFASVPVYTATFTVNSTADVVDANPGDGVCETVPGNKICTLRAAVQEAGASSAQNTIVVPAGTYLLSTIAACTYHDTGNSNLILENVSTLCVLGRVTIQGAGAAATIIDAGGGGRGILVSADANVNLSGLTIQNGKGNGGFVAFGGGGINNQGVLKVSDCIFTANAGIPGGGGIWNNGTLLLDGVTINGNSAGVYGGAGLYNNSNATADIVNSTFSFGNSVAQGGGLVNFGGTLRMSSSTINNNTASGGGGGLYNDYGTVSLANVTFSSNQGFTGAAVSNGQFGTVTANNVTATLNSATYHGGGVSTSGTFTILNSIVGGNTDPGPTPDDCEGAFVSQGHNLITALSSTCQFTGPATGDIYGSGPQLAALGSNGGRTQTHALLASSLAIDSGDPAAPGSGGTACAVADQRGNFRPQGTRCDIGAFEASATLGATGISPSHAANTGQVETVVSGSAFANGVTVRLSRSGQPDIPGVQVSVQPGNAALGAIFDLTGGAAGAWDVVVTNPNGTRATLPGAFRLDSGGTPQVWVNVVGPLLARPGTNARYFLLYGNRGNADALGVPVTLNTQTQTPLTVSVPIAPPPAQSGQVPTDWSTVPLYTLPGPGNGFVNLPLFVPIIPAGSSAAFPFTLGVPTTLGEGSSFVFSASTSTPFLNPSIDPAILTTMVNGAIQYAQTNLGAGGTSPSVASLTQYATNQIQATIVNGRAALVASTNASPLIYSLGQMNIDLARFAAASVGRSSVSEMPHASAKPAISGQAPSGGGSDCSGQVLGEGQTCGTKNDTKIPPPDSPNKPFTPADCRSIGHHYVSADGSMCKPEPGQGCPIIPNPFTPTDPNCTPIPIKTAVDPNAKWGPTGSGQQQFTTSAKAFGYNIDFENLASAPVPAQQVVVTDQLDTINLDLSTFSLGPISFGSYTLIPPAGTKHFRGGLDLRPAQNIVAVVDAGLNTTTGLVTWRFNSIDPSTLQITSDPAAGFLPPNTTPPQGEGKILYSIRPTAGILSGTTVCNQASVVFDTNAPINTARWCNTTDDLPPSSRVQALPASEPTNTFLVQWSGSDAGSGIHDYTIYVSDNGGAYAAWLQDTSLTQSNFTGASGHTYSFFSIARDNAGNTEATKTVADTTTTVGSGVTCAADVTAQFTVTLSGYRFNNATQRFQQAVTITRAASGSQTGPFALALKGLSSNATLYHAAGTTTCAIAGSPYVLVDPGSASWNTGQTVKLTLEFTNPTRTGITYTAVLLAGSTR